MVACFARRWPGHMTNAARRLRSRSSSDAAPHGSGGSFSGVARPVRWLLGPTQMVDTARAEQSLSEHTELVRAIQRRDAETAESIARKHLRSAHVQRMKTLFPVEDES